MTMPITRSTEWTDDHYEIVEFAEMLVDADLLESAKDVIYFLDKPWKWNNEHEAWVRHGRPADDTADGWFPFHKELEQFGHAPIYNPNPSWFPQAPDTDRWIGR